jgi:hypothetical protein
MSGHTYRVGNFTLTREVATKVLAAHGFEVSWDKATGLGSAHKGKRFGLLLKEPYIQLRLSFPVNTPHPSFRLESRASQDLGTLTQDLFTAFADAGLNYAVTGDAASRTGVGTSGMAGSGYDGRGSQGGAGAVGTSEPVRTPTRL